MKTNKVVQKITIKTTPFGRLTFKVLDNGETYCRVPISQLPNFVFDLNPVQLPGGWTRRVYKSDDNCSFDYVFVACKSEKKVKIVAKHKKCKPE